ncbi:aldehyde oxidase GLOX [Selaginella moellendorffii]|nr:aldehyde oxidase GLOX [Selaginella moellendorffii]|eukprot:XP_002961909.2 aldehyde oxidase GLOX [Selaginella moellendorffii]
MVAMRVKKKRDTHTQSRSPVKMGRVAALLAILLLVYAQETSAELRSPGTWKLLVDNAGISAMHMVLTHNNKVILFDGFSSGPSNISQPSGECKNTGSRIPGKLDCSAHSVEYDVATNTIRPLTIYTDTWCSSAVTIADGTLVQVGGLNNGSQTVRHLAACQRCDWVESRQRLAVKRRFSSSHLLPDNRVIVVGGRGQFSYEFVPRQDNEGVHELSFLAETNDLSQDNLYPFVHLTPDGNLFVFANSDSILLDYKTGKVVKRFPRMPGLEARNYPSSGSSVMLALEGASDYSDAQILVCGGADPYNYAQASRGNFLNASQNCGRIKLGDASPSWAMEAMPMPRVMGDMLLLPTGDVLIINGAQRGTAGWRSARNPALHPVLYKPNLKLYNRFQTLTAASRPRLHHSSAILLPDASVLVGGSNPNGRYSFATATDGVYPTDVSLEVFSPPYLDSDYAARRPSVTSVSTASPAHGTRLTVRYRLRGHFFPGTTGVALLAPPFASHAVSMGQRMIRLPLHNVTLVDDAPASISGRVPTYEIETTAPRSASVAPSGYYMLFVVHAGLPSHATWINLM